MDITKLTLQALKALAYDQMAINEQGARNLQAINQQIAVKSQQPTKQRKGKQNGDDNSNV